MNRIGDLLDKWLKDRGYQRAVKQQQVVIEWPYIVGEHLASSTEAVKVEAGVLWVKVKNSTWLHHLSMLKKQILRKISQYMGHNNVKDIYFFVGEISVTSPPDSEKKIDNLTEKEKEEGEPLDVQILEEWLARIPEDKPEFKEKLKTLLNKRYNIRG